MDPTARVVGWLHELGRSRAQHVHPVPGGLGLTHDRFPAAHDHNRLCVVAECDPSELADTAEQVLSDRDHRVIDVLTADLVDAIGAGLTGRGYQREDGLLMLAGGRAEPARPDITVVRLSLEQRQSAAALSWSGALPDAGPAVWWQLGHRIETVVPVADTAFFAVLGPDGAVAARADVYQRDGVAQVEEVVTDPTQRGRGYASALVLAAVAHARAADVVFLLADADDWPQQLYRRLGFSDLSRTGSFTRLSS